MDSSTAHSQPLEGPLGTWNSSAGTSDVTDGQLKQKTTATSDVFGPDIPTRAVLSNHSGHVGREKVGARDRSRSHSSPPTSRAPVLQPQSQLHQRKGNHRHRASGTAVSASGQENSSRQNHGKTKGQVQGQRFSSTLHCRRRPVLGDVTNVYMGTPAVVPYQPYLEDDDDSFANSTAVNTPRRNETPTRSHATTTTVPRGLMIELDGKPLVDQHPMVVTFDTIDDDHCLVYRSEDEFLPPVVVVSDSPTRKPTENVGLGPLAHVLTSSINGGRLPSTAAPSAFTTPLREALAMFSDMLSPSPTSKTKSRRASVVNNNNNNNDEPGDSSPRRLPAISFPTINIIPLEPFKFSNLTGSITQFTSELAASLAAHSDKEIWGQNQYEETAVAREERFDWEEAMRSLEVQCGVYTL